MTIRDRNQNLEVDGLLKDASMLVLVGSGGVGKTTVSAALGVRAAQLGRNVLVITIDPARRLATSLGLEDTGSKEVTVPAAVSHGEGSFSALMLDARSTFDDLIARITPNQKAAQRIFQNRIYRLISDSLAGSQNYMATEKLFEIGKSGRYDLIVLDTPPTSNALDFLDSSSFLIRFLDERIIRWFLPANGGAAQKVFSPASNLALRLLRTLFGSQFAGEILDFFDAFREIYSGFRERAKTVRSLFAAPGTHFGVVCRPERLSLLEAGHLVSQIKGRGYAVHALFANQCAPFSLATAAPDGTWLGEEGRKALRKIRKEVNAKLDEKELIASCEHSLATQVADAEDDTRLLRMLGPLPNATLKIPRRAEPIVELPALIELAKSLGS